MMATMHHSHGVRLVAVFEATKGLLVLLAGCGLFSLVHESAQRAAEQVVRHFHLNPANRFPRIFLDLADHLTDRELWVLAVMASSYAALRFAEAYGLWTQRRWAAWLAAVSGGIYLPVEIYEFAHHAEWLKGGLIAVNAGIVGYMIYILLRTPGSNAGRA